MLHNVVHIISYMLCYISAYCTVSSSYRTVYGILIQDYNMCFDTNNILYMFVHYTDISGHMALRCISVVL